MGDPEFELHAFMSYGGGFGDVSCSGAERNGTQYYWDYNNPPSSWTGNVLVVLESAISFGQVEYQVWEDDTGACTASGGRPPDTDTPTKNIITGTSAAIGWYYTDTKGNPIKILAKILAAVPIVLTLGGSIQDDDLVGVVSGPTAGCHPASGSSQHSVVRSGSTVGYVNLDFRFADARSPLCAPEPDPLPNGSVTITGRSTVRPNVLCLYSAASSAGTAPFTFDWYKDNGYIGTGAELTFNTGSSSFALQVIARDASGRTGYSLTKTVTVTSSTTVCAY